MFFRPSEDAVESVNDSEDEHDDYKANYDHDDDYDLPVIPDMSFFPTSPPPSSNAGDNTDGESNTRSSHQPAGSEDEPDTCSSPMPDAIEEVADPKILTNRMMIRSQRRAREPTVSNCDAEDCGKTIELVSELLQCLGCMEKVSLV